MPQQEHEDRVEAVHGALRGLFSGNYKTLRSVWKSKGADGLALPDLLTAEDIDLELVRGKPAEMAATITRYARLEASKAARQKVSPDNPAIIEALCADICGAVDPLAEAVPRVPEAFGR